MVNSQIDVYLLNSCFYRPTDSYIACIVRDIERWRKRWHEKGRYQYFFPKPFSTYEFIYISLVLTSTSIEVREILLKEISFFSPPIRKDGLQKSLFFYFQDTEIHKSVFPTPQKLVKSGLFKSPTFDPRFYKCVKLITL